jgi:hypothetical protein
MRRLMALFLILALCMLLPHCGGEHKTLAISRSVGGYVGSLGLVVQTPFDDSTKSQLTADDLAKLQQMGITLQNGLAVLPEQPLAGAYVDVGGTRYMVGLDGLVHIPSLPPGTQDNAVASVYRQLTDTQPLGSFPLNQLVADGTTPTRYDIHLSLPTPNSMNPDSDLSSDTRAAKPKGRATLWFTGGCAARGNVAMGLCAPGNNTGPGCCVDYNGPGGDGRALNRAGAPQCFAQAALNFTGSTCSIWVARGVCANEGAFIPGGPSCWTNHGRRNCQNLGWGAGGVIILGPAGAAGGEAEVGEGEKLSINIHNISMGNETAVRFVSTGAGGTLSGPVESGYGGYFVRHYNTTQHLDDAQVSYVAPQLPPGVTDATDIVEFDAGGVTTIFTFKVHKASTPPPPTSSGTSIG